MAVPTGYTFETFAQFVYFEVLLHVADTMMWFVARPVDPEAEPEFETIELALDWPANAGIAEFTLAKTQYLNVGTEVTFEGDEQVYTVVEIGQGANYNGSKLRAKFFPYNLEDKAAGIEGTYEKKVASDTASPIVTDPTYEYMLTEVLTAMGLTSITEINSSNIKEFRAMARIEAWRAVLGNCVSMTNSDTQEGESYLRGQVFASAQQQLQIAEQEFNAEFGNTVFSSGSAYGSDSGTVIGVW